MINPGYTPAERGARRCGECSQVKVTYTNSDFGNDVEEEFDTVILAVGRDACTPDLGLEAVGLALEKSGKLAATHEQTHVDNIFAVGDVLESRQELTPVAIQVQRPCPRWSCWAHSRDGKETPRR